MHFQHGNIIKYAKRPFLTEEEMSLIEKGTSPNARAEDYDAYRKLRLSKESVSKHDEMLVERWNECVKPGDRVYHLGDFAFGDSHFCNKILDRLNGQIHFIEGNHDKPAYKVRHRFASYQKYYELKIQDPDAPRGTRKLILFHNPILSWNSMYHETFHLHGHCHGNLEKFRMEHIPHLRFMDVGVDMCDYYPISYEEVKAHMKTKKGQSVDHH